MAIYHNNKKIVKIYHGNIPITRSYHGGILIYKEFNILDYNLISNSDLLIDSNSDAVPNGVYYSSTTTDKTLVNGIAKFTVTAQWGYFSFPNTDSFTVGDTYFIFSRFKSSSSGVRLVNAGPLTQSYHSGSNEYEYHSLVTTKTTTNNGILIEDTRASGWTPIEVDYMGAINITDLVSRGILPSGLTNEQYKTLLDSLIQ